MNLDSQVDKTQNFENCVLCGKLTNVRKDTPIEKRLGYVEGAGQLDPECYRKIYFKDIQIREQTIARRELSDLGIILGYVN